MRASHKVNPIADELIAYQWKIRLEENCNSGLWGITNVKLNSNGDLIIVYTDIYSTDQLQSIFNRIKKTIQAFHHEPFELPIPKMIGNREYQLVIDNDTFQKIEQSRDISEKKHRQNMKHQRNEEHLLLAKKREKLATEMDQLSNDHIKKPVFVRFFREPFDVEISESQTKFKPSNLYVPGVKQQLIHASTFHSSHERVASGLSKDDIALIIDPFHENTRLQYWSKKDAQSDHLYEDILKYKKIGKDHIKMKPSGSLRKMGFEGTKVHIQSEYEDGQGANRAFIEAFIDKIVLTEMRRRSRKSTYKTTKGKIKKNIYSDHSMISMHNEGGIHYSIEAINGIFIQDDSLHAIKYALDLKKQIEKEFKKLGINKSIDFVMMREGYLVKLDERDLQNALHASMKTPDINTNQKDPLEDSVLDELNNLVSSKKYNVKWSLHVGKGGKKYYGFSSQSDSIRNEIHREFEQHFPPLTLNRALIQSKRGRSISYDDLNEFIRKRMEASAHHFQIPKGLDILKQCLHWNEINPLERDKAINIVQQVIDKMNAKSLSIDQGHKVIDIIKKMVQEVIYEKSFYQISVFHAGQNNYGIIFEDNTLFSKHPSLSADKLLEAINNEFRHEHTIQSQRE